MSDIAIGAILTLLGGAITGLFAFLLQMKNASTAAKKEDRAGQIEMDKVALEGVTSAQRLMGEAQAMMQIQASRRDEDVRELRIELGQLKAELVEANKEIALLKVKLDESEKLRDPLHKEIADLKDQVAGLEKTIAGLQETIAGLQTTIDTLQSTIDELRAQIKGQESPVNG